MKHLLLLTLLFLPLASLQAQERPALRLVTSPLPVTVTTTPGQSATTDLKVKNDGTAPETLQIRLMKFRAYEESGQPALEEPDGTEEFLKWVSFSQNQFTLAPGEWQTVSVTFSPPDTAALGYYYAFVFTRADDSVPAGASQTALTGGTAILTLLNVDVPGAKKSVRLDAFKTDKNFYEFLPVSFTTRLENDGNIFLAPRGNIFISRGDKPVGMLEVNLEQGNILPGSFRAFETLWEDGFPHYVPKVENGAVVKDEQGQVEQELEWNFADVAKLRFGKYTAKLVLIYDNGERDVPLEAEVSFWVVPWRGLLVALVVAVFFFLGVRSTLQKLVNKIFRRRGKEV